MKKIISYISTLIAILIVIKTNAQQSSLFNTYSLDPLQLNIAYAGATCTEINAHYRTQWIGLKETPKLLQLNAHTALGKSNALALKVNSQTQGLLNTLGATLGYSYRIKLNENAKLHLGLGVGWSQAALNTQNANVIQANDATLNNNNRQSANGVDSEFGVMFVGKKLKAGSSVLHLYNSNPSFSGSSSYKNSPQINTQVSYIFNKDKKIELEPWLLNRYTLQGDNVIEGMLNLNFIKAITVGFGYRSNNGVLALLGAKIGNLKFAYSFDYGSNKNAVSIGTSHQVMLGFSICKTSKPKEVKEVKEVVVKATPIDTLPTISPIVEETKEEPKKDSIVKIEAAEVETPVVTIDKLNKIAEEVVFDINQFELNEIALKKVDDLAILLKINPSLKVNIIRYASSKGSAEVRAENDLLSIRRVTYLRAELTNRGVKSENISCGISRNAEKALFDNSNEQQSASRTVRFEGVK